MALSLLEEARRLSALGFNIVPTRRGKKSPAVKWEEWQHRRSDYMVDSWFAPGSGFTGVFTVTGSISRLLVLDIDSAQGDSFWRAVIGNEMEMTACVKTNKGHHYYFVLDEGQVVDSWKSPEGAGMSFDVQAEGHGVMTPPSAHPSGGYYEWVRDPSAFEPLPCPKWLLNGLGGIAALLAGENPETAQIGTDAGTPAVSSILSSLLRKPATAGGRNAWLAKVAGHYAKSVTFEDAYQAMVEQANRQLNPPLDDAEVAKTADSIWRTHHAKHPGMVEQLAQHGIVAVESNPVEGNGWLVGAGGVLWAPAKQGSGNDAVEELRPWSDFDVRVLGVVENEDGETVDYLVALTTKHEVIECVLKSSVLGRGNDLTAWLMARRATIVGPPGDLHAKVSGANRLGRYVKSQAAPTYRMTATLGWDDATGTFLCHEGVLRAGGEEVESFEGVRPSMSLLARNSAPYHYGFTGTRYDAQDVLREVMTFHDETVCAVFGAWWAASFLKPQIMKRAALFPFMALEAPSGSGKTNGFFALMVQMNGNAEGHGQQTTAVFRDRASAHNAGVVWIDDVSELSDVLDIIRQATSGGSRSKKSFDNSTNEKVTLVSPIVLSGEGITGLGGEKALSDRAVTLSVPLPNERVSLRDSGRSQWLDITDLMDKFPGKNGSDLTQIAGWFVSMALECVEDLDSENWNALRPSGALARFGDSMTILRIGARVLEHLMGVENGLWVGAVDAWVEERIAEYNPDANVLTNTILPAALRQYETLRRSPSSDTMIFLDEDGRVNYSEARVGDWWNAKNHISTRERQLGELSSMREQRVRIIGGGLGQQRFVAGRGSTRVRYYALPVELSAWIVDRAGFDVD